MSNLSKNTTDLQAILAAVNALPDAGGGSGGASVETCSVTLTCSDGNATVLAYYYLCYENETIMMKYGLPPTGGSSHGTPLTLTNVVCGSEMCVRYGGSSTATFITVDGIEIIIRSSNVVAFSVTAGAGYTASIDRKVPSGGGPV